jgi:DNA polymerase I-like protein with 3'-5' exonuclease and polymerase domains
MALFGGINLPGHPDLDNVRRVDALVSPMLRKMMRAGIAIDREYMWDLGSQFAAEMISLSKDITSYIPPEHLDKFVSEAGLIEEEEGDASINPASAEQIGKLLFTCLDLGADKSDKLKRTKQGKLSTGKRQLETLRYDHPVVVKVLQYREVAKLKTTYCNALPDLARFHPRSQCCPVCELKHVDDHWRVHGEIGTTRTATWRFNHKNPNCFSGDTEVLTHNGWVRLDVYNQTDQIAQWDSGKISFVGPTGYIKQISRQIIRNHTSDQIDLLTTPDHRCLLQNRKTDEWNVFRASAYPSDYKQWHSGHYQGGGSGYSEMELAFIIALQADGSWNDRRSMDFSFVKSRKIERFREIVDSIGLHYRMKKDARRTRFYIGSEHNPSFTLAMYDLLGGRQKLFPWSLFLSLNKFEADFVMNEIMLWDGDSVSKCRYASKHKHNTDIVSTLFALNGRRAVSRPRINQTGCRFWMADISKTGYSLTTNRKHEIIEWNDYVYCVSVPSTFLLVRRNGKIHVTGNCGNIPTRTDNGQLVQAGFIATPGKVLYMRDLSQIELRDLAHLSNCASMIEVYLNDGDLHDDTCHRALGVPWDQKPDKIKHRMAAKRVNFGIQNGTTEKGLYAQLVTDFGLNRIPIPDWLTELWCKEFIESWLQSRPEVLEFFDRMWYLARRYRMVWNPFGFVRLIPEVISAHSWIREAGLRQAQNLPVTSFAAGHMKLSMARCDHILAPLYEEQSVWPLMTIHDALMFEIDEDREEDMDELTGWAFDGCMDDADTGERRFRVPIKSDAESAVRWVK